MTKVTAAERAAKTVPGEGRDDFQLIGTELSLVIAEQATVRLCLDDIELLDVPEDHNDWMPTRSEFNPAAWPFARLKELTPMREAPGPYAVSVDDGDRLMLVFSADAPADAVPMCGLVHNIAVFTNRELQVTELYLTLKLAWVSPAFWDPKADLLLAAHLITFLQLHTPCSDAYSAVRGGVVLSVVCEIPSEGVDQCAEYIAGHFRQWLQGGIAIGADGCPGWPLRAVEHHSDW